MRLFSISRLILLLVLVLLLLFVGMWLSQRIERVTEEKYVGYQGEARYNPLLAAQRLLKKMHIDVKAVHHLPNIEHSLQQGDVLFLIQSHRPLSASKSKALLAWVARGGHALLVSNTLHNQQNFVADPTLESLQVEQFDLGLDTEAVRQAGPVAVKLNKNSFHVNFHPDYILSLSETSKDGSIVLRHLLHLGHGEGDVTLLTDAWFLHNARIGELDHAAFFWALLNLQQRPQRVWLVYPLSKNLVDSAETRRKPTQGGYCEDCEDSEFAAQTPPLWQILWKNVWYVMISLLTLLLFALWRATRRFGSLLAPPSEQRRSLLEHIEASGEFFWRSGQANQLLRGLRQSVFKDLQRQHPAWLNLSHADISQRIGQHCAMAPDKVSQSLYHVEFSSSAAFTEAVQCLKHIQRAL